MKSVGTRIRFTGNCDELYEGDFVCPLFGIILSNSTQMEHDYLVQFDMKIPCGHDGGCFYDHRGRNGYCYYVDKKNIKSTTYSQHDMIKEILI